MAPRQRCTTPPSLDDMSVAGNDLGRPLIPSSLSSSDDIPTSTTPFPSRTVGGSAEVGVASPKPVKSNGKTNQSTAEAAAAILASDIAREQHDFFNLIALLFVVATTLINWNLSKLVQGYGPGVAWTGNYFYVNWATTVLYFLADLIWVSLVPICVKSPDVIIKHHIVAIAYLSAPLVFPEYRWFMGACLSVEINTWFLILRRVVYKRKESIPFIVTEFVSLSFYVSWIIIRCFIYPAMLIIFLQLAREKVETTGRLWHWAMIFIPVHFFLCVLNLKWSYDLFEPIVRRWMKPDAEEATISSGL